MYSELLEFSIPFSQGILSMVTETILPRIVRGVTDELKKELQYVEWYSFTTDIWSTEVSNDCLLSLTVLCPYTAAYYTRWCFLSKSYQRFLSHLPKYCRSF